MLNTNNEKTVRPELVEGSNGIDKKLKACAAISIAFHVVLLFLAMMVAAPKRAPGPITIELTTAGLTNKAGLSGEKHAPGATFHYNAAQQHARRRQKVVTGASIKKASHAAPPHSAGGRPADEFPAPLEKDVTVEEHPMAGEEKQESNTFEAAAMPSAENHGGTEDSGSSGDYEGSENYGGSEGNGNSGVKSAASGSRHTAQFLSLVREKIEKAKFYPPLARKKGYEGVVRVGFTIKKNGKFEDIHVLRPCHCEALDSAATEAIKKASPFGPVPETFPDEGIRLEIDVAYRLTD